jgi:adenylate cyclase
MPSVGAEVQAVRRQLERILRSPGFARNDRLSRFLRFVVERHTEGRDHELKESVIAIEVFGRQPDYNPKHDAIVRIEAGRLRARLSEYYLGDGKRDALIIDIPRGGYIPVFRETESAPENNHSAQRSPRSRLGARVGLLGMALTLAATGLWWVQHKSAPIPIAVLPLNNLDPDPANDYFADGLTDEIIRNLSIIDGLAVRSQTSSFAFKGKPRNVRDAGEQLQADYILEGSVLRAGRMVRINAQLVRARDDFSLWSGRFDRELTDLLTIQDEISRSIVNSLRLKLGRGRRRYETSTEAYDRYLHARALAIHRGDSRVAETIASFEQSIALDASFAPAYAGLGRAAAIRSIEFMYDHPPDELSKVRAAAERAIQLDPLLAEAHEARAMVQAREGQWEGAEKSFRRAIELDANGSSTYTDFAVFLLNALGRNKEALQQSRIAEKNDPLSSEVHRCLAIVLVSAGRFDEAAEQSLKMPPDSFRIPYLARARLGQGRVGEAIQLLAHDVDRTKLREEMGLLGYAYARAGRREEAEKLVAGQSDPNTQVLIYAGLGDKNRALQALDRFSVVGAQRLGMYLNYPELGLLRGDPRVKALRRKVGLPE